MSPAGLGLVIGERSGRLALVRFLHTIRPCGHLVSVPSFASPPEGKGERLGEDLVKRIGGPPSTQMFSYDSYKN